MSVSIGKQKQCLFHLLKSSPLFQNNSLEIKIGTTVVEVSNTEKLLEVTIDNTVNWSSQLDVTIKSEIPIYFYLSGSKYIWTYQQGLL